MDDHTFDELHRHVNLWLQDASTDAPVAWRVMLAIFLPNTLGIEAHRPVVPSALLVVWVWRSLLHEHEAQLEPRKLCVEGLFRGGTADALVASEWKCVQFLRADLLNAFGTSRYPLVWRALGSAAMGPQQRK